MESLTLQPMQQISGEITLPGSKSLSNRILLLAALSQGQTEITNLLDSDDVRYMLAALKQLGVDYILSDNNTRCVLTGLGGPLGAEQCGCSALKLYLGNAGTAMRPLTAALCLGHKGEFILEGDPRMYERPIGDLVNCLRQAGAAVDYLGEPGFPPLRIHPHDQQRGGLAGGKVTIDGSLSSQFLTAMLMAAPLAQDDTEITIKGELVSRPYIDITLDIMQRFGVTVENHNYQRFVIKGQQQYQSPGQIMVEGDASSASYFLAAAAISGGPVTVHGVGSLSVQGDKHFADALAGMGAEISWGETWIRAARPSASPLCGLDADMNHIPDAAMTLATTALFAEGDTVLRNIYNWRVKETDRLSAMATELRKVGATVVEGEDFIRITPPQSLVSAAIDTYDDHRMAMCFALAAFGPVPITINDPGCTSKTFPDFFTVFQQLTR